MAGALAQPPETGLGSYRAAVPFLAGQTTVAG